MGLRVGSTPEPRTYPVTRAHLVAYAGASGDRNPIHWSDRAAREIGLPGVVAHGMYTLALAGRAVADWAGGPERVLELGARFTRPVVVPDDDLGVDVRVTGTVAATEHPATVRVELTVTCADRKVLGAARALVLVEPDA
ncbi:MAG: MaoC/PaaZ C-terminal domain-containing protein [Nocardioidaceae bacterium]